MVKFAFIANGRNPEPLPFPLVPRNAASRQLQPSAVPKERTFAQRRGERIKSVVASHLFPQSSGTTGTWQSVGRCDLARLKSDDRAVLEMPQGEVGGLPSIRECWSVV